MNKAILAISSIVFAMLAGACKTKLIHVPVETEKLKVEYVDKLQRDTLQVLDSVFVFHRGDTVFKEKFRYVYRNKLLRDSVHIYDSVMIQVPYPVEVLKEVNRLYNWQIVLMVLGGVAIGYVGFSLWRRK